MRHGKFYFGIFLAICFATVILIQEKVRFNNGRALFIHCMNADVNALSKPSAAEWDELSRSVRVIWENRATLSDNICYPHMLGEK